MLTLKMLIHQPAIDGLQLRINAAQSTPCAPPLPSPPRCVPPRGRLCPSKWPVLIDDDPRRMQRIGLTQRFDNHPGVQLVGLVHLLCAKRPGAGNIAEEVVRMGGAERRDRQPRLRPGGGVRRMVPPRQGRDNGDRAPDGWRYQRRDASALPPRAPADQPPTCHRRSLTRRRCRWA